ncbi:hypothetical protein [Nostoc sp.]|uniref:hypothetical protein n=1 Tax=Nostoc sp. TaxID=1180 RepID=UPI002FF6537C
MTELANKVLFCLQMMDLIRWLTLFIQEEFRKRILARYVLIYLDTFLKLALQLKNQLKRSQLNVSTVNRDLRAIERDYEEFYTKIRDKVADHRQDLPIDELVEAWNEIDNTTVNIFIDSAIDIYRSMVSLNSNILPFVSSPDMRNCNLQKQLVDILNAPNFQPIKISADSLAMTQQNTIFILPINEMQERCSQIVSIFNSFNFSNSLYAVLKLGQDTQRLAKVIFVIDVFNFIDNLYPYNSSIPEHKIKSLLEICQQEEWVRNTRYSL